MSRCFNFSAGPAALPEAVLRQAQAELLEWNGTGASVMEVSHRGKAFMDLAAESERDLRELLSIPDHYRVLFLQGGATQHFAQIPMNLARRDQVADYVLTGAWSEKAAREASPYTTVRVAASAQAGGYVGLPPAGQWRFDASAAYVHIVSNETIHGVQFADPPDTGEVPLVADMSSDILSRPIDVARYGLIYAGAQKNIGASGLVVMIVREDLLARCPADIARIFSYAEHAAQHSLLNTPNTFGWYLASLVFKWLKAQGGVAAMAARNREKAAALYAAIDGSEFYRNPVDPAARSAMNVPFTLPRAELDEVFLRESHEAGLLALKGHKLVGGMRASLYNAVTLEAVQALVAFMQDFARRHG
ncbi:MAG: 3-phosphoserine/phosphohydroxythreonine transaminase [Rhodanobacter denitrificans]|uniref:Phosphoserine aminotransferase n=1 Tax=Rhodanobacter denitrificans TaxID=666685 RepID=A0A2W5KQS9_9GAMM|nr:MAG: 3-phosphoserine/phosphohydroxythreonine transaminase [Rhodanobacter denitrificans]